MEPDQLRLEVSRQIEVIDRALNRFPSDSIASRIAELRTDIDLDLYTVVVLGEFNRGKSSLVNALIGQDILPTDVNPTTATINIVRYSEDASIRLQRVDGTSEDLAFSSDALSAFTGDVDAAEVRYLEIGVPAPLLQNGMVLVDTPGVDDINDQRVEVTYNFVPRADAVIFVLSALSPLTRSEVEFLQTAVLKEGISRIVFVVNYIDCIEEEERQEFVKRLQNRIASALPGFDGKLYATSAIKASQFHKSGDESLYSQSGMAGLNAGVEELKNTRTLDKLQRQTRRLRQIKEGFREELRTAAAVCDATDEELLQQLEALNAQLSDNNAREEKLRQWLGDREREVTLMIRKSCSNFRNSMLLEMRDQVQSYNGTDFEQFVTETLPRLARLRMKEWIEAHTTPLSALLERIAEEMSESLCHLFNSTVAPVTANATWQGINPSTFNLPAIKIGNAAIEAGLIGGGAAALILILGAPALVPIVGMAGLPFLRDQLHKMKLEKAKQSVLPEIDAAVEAAISTFEQQVMSAFKAEMETMANAAEQRFEDLLGDLRRELTEEIGARGCEMAQSKDRREDLARVLAALDEDDVEVVVGLDGCPISSNEVVAVPGESIEPPALLEAPATTTPGDPAAEVEASSSQKTELELIGEVEN